MEWILEFGNRHFATITVKAGPGKNHQQILNVGGHSEEDVCMILKCLPTDCFQIQRGKSPNYAAVNHYLSLRRRVGRVFTKAAPLPLYPPEVFSC